MTYTIDSPAASVCRGTLAAIWTPGEKKAIVEATEKPEMGISTVTHKYGLHPNQLFTWRRLMHEGAL